MNDQEQKIREAEQAVIEAALEVQQEGDGYLVMSTHRLQKLFDAARTLRESRKPRDPIQAVREWGDRLLMVGGDVTELRSSLNRLCDYLERERKERGT